MNASSEPLLYVVLFVLGTVIGSFLNVVLYRLHTGRSLSGRSHCMTCGKTLAWYELVPMFSYLFQRARCMGCSARIPVRYFAVELATGLLFVLAWHFFGSDYLRVFLYLILVSLLVVIAVYDIHHTIIPDELTAGATVVALMLVSYECTVTGSIEPLLYGAVAGLCAAIFFAGLWYLSRGRWLGLGDAKLSFPLGLIVGAEGVFSMVVFSFWIGAVISLSIMAVPYMLNAFRVRFPSAGVAKYPRYFTMKSEVPFAPFLILGFLIVQFLHADIFDITYVLLYP